jgi:hypothetical protein
VSVCVCRRGIVVVVLCFVFYCCCCCTTTLWGFHSHFRLFISDLFSILSTFPFSLSPPFGPPGQSGTVYMASGRQRRPSPR